METDELSLMEELSMNASFSEDNENSRNILSQFAWEEFNENV